MDLPGPGEPVKAGDVRMKTPLWCLNELARHHKLKPIFNVVNEEGQWNTKKFTVSLNLNGETWKGTGPNKKQAYQTVAQDALKNTSLTMPPKNKKPDSTANPHAITPAVILNGMAMSMGMPVTYAVIGKEINTRMLQLNSQQQHLHGMSADDLCNSSFRNNAQKTWNFHNQMSNYRSSKYPEVTHKVCVTVGDQKYYGEGPNIQAARHDAANSAILFLQTIKADRTPPRVNAEGQTTSVQTDRTEMEKSPISSLYEEALPRNMSVIFNTVSESGPAHLRVYAVEVVVGFFSDGQLNEERSHFKAEGSGCPKKVAKQQAAALVVEKMKGLPPLLKRTPKQKPPAEVIPPASRETKSLHPVSRLLQIMQAQKGKDPVYSPVIDDNENQMKNYYYIKCTVEDKCATGHGKTKKEAKRAAAEAMLDLQGYQWIPESAVPNLNMIPTKPSLKSRSSVDSSPKQVKFAELVQQKD